MEEIIKFRKTNRQKYVKKKYPHKDLGVSNKTYELVGG